MPLKASRHHSFIAHVSCCSYSHSIHVLCRKEHVQKFIDCQVKDVAKFEAERDELIKVHEEKKMRLKKEYMEKELDAALTSLMEKHKLRPPARKGASAATSDPHQLGGAIS